MHAVVSVVVGVCRIGDVYPNTVAFGELLHLLRPR